MKMKKNGDGSSSLRKGLKPGAGGEKPPGDSPFGFQLKAVPLKFIKELKDIVLQEAESIGSAAMFECEVSPSTAVTSWLKDGSNLRESPKHKFTSDGKDRKLAIIDVQLSDTGEYTCVATLGKKEKTSTAKLIAKVTVKGGTHLIFVADAISVLNVDKTVQPAKPAEVSAAPAPVKKLDNLFFIDEPKSLQMSESKLPFGNVLTGVLLKRSIF
uniref:Ig-like domain-containing protein n=1 Tax=Denticeps clupeoides TaxID=299321 RepID=A0AAY4EXS5_9TELE